MMVVGVWPEVDDDDDDDGEWHITYRNCSCCSCCRRLAPRMMMCCRGLFLRGRILFVVLFISIMFPFKDKA